MANYKYALIQGKATLEVQGQGIKVTFLNDDGSPNSNQPPLLFGQLPLKALFMELIVGFDREQLTDEQIEGMVAKPMIEVVRTVGAWGNSDEMNPIPPPRG